GASLGGAIAPLVAAGDSVRGVIVFGTFARTWYEHILGHERRKLELSATTYPEITRRMQMLEDLYARYLLGGDTPGAIVARRPEYAEVWDDLPRHQYGRPVSFFQDVQRFNVAAAWDSLDVPVLVLYGEHDWVRAREDHELIVRMVNARRPGSAELVVLEGVDHNLMRYADPASAFRGEGGVVAEELPEAVARWLSRVGPP
ncbi:MAG TPA: alpha/beta hydrolase, partial [Gemmatimonadales bacterium]